MRDDARGSDASADCFSDMNDGVSENLQALPFGGQGGAACPGEMLEGIDISFGVGHQAENEAGGVADAGDVID